MSKPEINNTLDHLFRQEYTKMVSLFTNRYSSALIDQIEDAVQESLLKAAKLWNSQPVPENPSAWLYRVANNQLIDQLRRQNKLVDYKTQKESKYEATSEFEFEEGEFVATLPLNFKNN